MRCLNYSLIGLMIFSTSCAATNKRSIKSSNTVVEQVTPKAEEKKLPDSKPPVKDMKEVEEKLVPYEQVKINPLHFFVIVGSFREQGNAKKRQKELLNAGFSSEILKNEAGLYRVSVFATDEIDVARDDVRRIRSIFPEYKDTWLLIQKR